MNMNKLNNNSYDNNISKSCISILKGCAISFAITIVLLIIFAILLTYTSISESIIKPMIIVITGLSILIGSSISTIKANKNGIIKGGIVGIIYILLLYLLSSIAGVGFDLNIYSIAQIIISVLTGMIGGIVGVNIK